MSGFASDFSAHKGRKDSVSPVTCNMSLGFRKGIESNFPDAQSVIDKFHVVKHLNEALDNLKRRESKENGELISWMMRSRIEEAKKVARMYERHFKEILNYFLYRKTNAILEGMNSVIRNIKRRARGFKNLEYFKLMIYLNCGGLNIRTVKLA